MPDRCSRCRGNTGGTAEAHAIGFNQACKILSGNIMIVEIKKDIIKLFRVE